MAISPVVNAERQERFRVLYRANYGRVLAYALRRSAPEVAHDVVADTFLVAWRRLDRVPVDPLPWLLGVARKTLATHRRSEQRQSSLLCQLEAQHALRARLATDLVDDECTLRVAEAVARLPERDQELLRLVVWDGLSTKQAGVVLGVSHVASRVRLHRARRKLTALLEQDEERDQSPRAGPFEVKEEPR
jgi:RNA polymerase sigma-70 factor, ECF subfamily